jgi:hypothetical protein
VRRLLQIYIRCMFRIRCWHKQELAQKQRQQMIVLILVAL